jgi:hypothetical protein
MTDLFIPMIYKVGTAEILFRQFSHRTTALCAMCVLVM